MSDQVPALDPKHTALLVMDFQRGLLRRMPGMEPLLARVQGAIADVRERGGTTSGVVLSTLVEAADRDYRLYVLSDGTEDPDEQTRDVLLGQVFPRRAQVIDTATLRGLLSP